MRKRWAGICAAIAVCAPLLVVTPAVAVQRPARVAGFVHADDYPTWGDVKQAQQKASTAKAELQRIDRKSVV